MNTKSKELDASIRTILNCMTAADGGVSFCRLKALLETVEPQEAEHFNKTIQPLVRLIHHCEEQ